MKKTTYLIAAVLAIATATVFTSGPAALGSNAVQEAQANPCSESHAAGSLGGQQIVQGDADELESNTNCEFYGGNYEFNGGALP